MKKIKKPFKTAFLQHWGTFPYDTLVVVGMDAGQMMKTAKRLLPPSPSRKELLISLQDKEEMDKVMDCGGWCDWLEGGQSVIWLKGWDLDWKYLDILNHEIVHAVDFFYKHVTMDGMETRAYQQDFLFKQIRNRLNSIMINKVK